MDGKLPIFMPTTILEALGEHVGLFWSDFKMSDVICEAISAYMQPAPALAQAPAGAAGEAGYQWKQVFLPDGTRLRATFKRQPWFAIVEGGEVLCDGDAMSPSAFANLLGSGNRNAWKAVWLRFPGSSDWVLADICRAARLAGIARMFGPDATTARQGVAAVPRRRRRKTKAPAKLRSTTAAAPKQKRSWRGNPPSLNEIVQGMQDAIPAEPPLPLSRRARRKLRRMKQLPGNP